MPRPEEETYVSCNRKIDSSSVSVAAGIEAVHEFRRAYSPPCKGGGGRAIKNMGPFRKGADGVVARE